MKNTDDQFIIIGKFSAPFGVNGWIKIQPYTKPKAAILDYKNWHIHTNLGWEKADIADRRIQGESIMALFKGIDQPEIVKQYTEKEIAIPRDQLTKLKKDEYYWADLEGLIVTTKNGIKLGKIDSLFETRGNDVMVVIGGKRHLIPFIRKQVVLEIDLVKKIMVVDWDPEF